VIEFLQSNLGLGLMVAVILGLGVYIALLLRGGP
jgi:hypothetical protein